MTISEKLISKGFQVWEKGEMKRIYINPSSVGYEWDTYKTGNISDAWLNEKTISNCEMRRVLGSKTYVDVKTDKIHSTYPPMKEAAEAMIKAFFDEEDEA